MSEPFREGRESLVALFQQLSRMRGAQSRYLQPLLENSHTVTCQMFTFPMDLGSIEISNCTGIEGEVRRDGQDEELADCRDVEWQNLPDGFISA